MIIYLLFHLYYYEEYGIRDRLVRLDLLNVGRVIFECILVLLAGCEGMSVMALFVIGVCGAVSALTEASMADHWLGFRARI